VKTSGLVRIAALRASPNTLAYIFLAWASNSYMYINKKITII